MRTAGIVFFIQPVLPAFGLFCFASGWVASGIKINTVRVAGSRIRQAGGCSAPLLRIAPFLMQTVFILMPPVVSGSLIKFQQLLPALAVFGGDVKRPFGDFFWRFLSCLCGRNLA